MAHISKMSSHIRAAVAGATIPEGALVQLTNIGVRGDLPVALPAASGTTKNVYVAMVPPDNFSRPTPSQFYTAPFLAVQKESGPWSDNTETGTFYNVGLSTLENPTMASGYLLQAHKATIVHVPSGLMVANNGLKVVGALVKVADDGSGKYALTTLEAAAVGRIVEYDSSIEQYTVEIGWE